MHIFHNWKLRSCQPLSVSTYLLYVCKHCSKTRTKLISGAWQWEELSKEE